MGAKGLLHLGTLVAVCEPDMRCSWCVCCDVCVCGVCVWCVCACVLCVPVSCVACVCAEGRM